MTTCTKCYCFQKVQLTSNVPLPLSLSLLPPKCSPTLVLGWTAVSPTCTHSPSPSPHKSDNRLHKCLLSSFPSASRLLSLAACTHPYSSPLFQQHKKKDKRKEKRRGKKRRKKRGKNHMCCMTRQSRSCQSQKRIMEK